MKKLSRFLLAIFAGATLSYSYNRVIWWLAIFAIVVFIRQLKDAQLALRLQISLVFFVTYWASVISWLHVLGSLPWVLLTVVCTLPMLLIALGSGDFRSLRGVVTFAATWVVAEYLHAEYPWGGFAWGLVAHTQTSGPFMVLAQFGGQYLTTFGIVLVAGTLSNFAKLNSWLPIGVSAGVVAVMHLSVPNLESLKQIDVVAIQGSVPRNGFDYETQRRAVLSNHLAATRDYLKLSARKADLVIWPENAVDNDPINTTYVRMRVDEISNELATPLLVGGLVAKENTDREFNAGILWQAGAPGAMYAKHQLVPFGEYIPTGKFLQSWIAKQFTYLPRIIPGDTNGIFTINNNVKFGNLICFEIANEEYARQRVTDGAEFLTVQTNNATYENTSQPKQQLNITRFRAIENHRAIAVAATTGHTVVIAPDGRIVSQLEPKTRGYALATIDLFNRQMPVHRWNTNVFVLICLLTALFGVGKFRWR